MATVAVERTCVAAKDQYGHPVDSEQIRLVLLGLGQVGSAIATSAHAATQPGLRITGALVRHTGGGRARQALGRVGLTTDPAALLDTCPDVVVEALGGLEPALSIVLDALGRGIPVVTANKALVATHGDELFAAAADAGVPLRYEATVVAGVPFLGGFGARPNASSISAVTGIVNGTSNFILSRMPEERVTYADGLRDAQSRGLAEPDPSSDVRGIDAANKLAILLRHYGRWSVRPGDIETRGIEPVDAYDLQQAAAFGGAIKPVASASWDDTRVTAFAGPAFVPASHPLAHVHGLQNGILLTGGASGTLFHSGPGAGPEVTAATVLDDVGEAVEETRRGRRVRPHVRWRPACPDAPETGWFVRISAPALPRATEVADLLAAHDVWALRTSETRSTEGRPSRWVLTYPCIRERVERALAALRSASGCAATTIRALEVGQ